MELPSCLGTQVAPTFHSPVERMVHRQAKLMLKLKLIKLSTLSDSVLNYTHH